MGGLCLEGHNLSLQTVATTAKSIGIYQHNPDQAGIKPNTNLQSCSYEGICLCLNLDTIKDYCEHINVGIITLLVLP